MIRMKYLAPYFILTFFLLSSCQKNKPQYIIGVSQCSEDEWRTQMNKEINREALFYPEVQVEIRSVKDNSRQQAADIDAFVSEGVDLLIVSPNEADTIRPAIERAFDAGIPVVLVDRKIHSEKYTAYVGADNYAIGRQAGIYIASLLHGKGNIIELTGLTGSTPATERHRGLLDAFSETGSNINLITSVDAGWFEDRARQVIDTLLPKYKDIDLIFSQNDRMAIGAYHSAEQQGRADSIDFVGIDAVSEKGFGIDQLAAGVLDATFIYPTGGDRVIQVAMAILQGKPYERETLLSSALVDRSNARIMQMETEYILTLDKKIELLDQQLDTYLLRYSSQRMFLWACIIILLLVAILLVFTVRAFWTKTRMNAKLSHQKSQLEKQRDQLIDLSHRLEEATHAKLAFFTNVSHDFRTPLTLIADPIDQLRSSNHLDERERTLLDIAHKNIIVLLRLVNQILDFRRFENGKLTLHLSQFNILSGIKEWAEAFRTLSYRKHIRFDVSATGSSEDYLMTADAEKMERITYNLLSNAFKFTPEGGCIQMKLSRFKHNDSPWLRLTLSDTGIGMSAEHIQHIFDRFYQIDVHHGGSGIGLALVKAFVDMHHGHIEVKSIEKQGTTFIIEMPMQQAGNAEETITSSALLSNLKEGAVLDADMETLSRESESVTRQDDKETVLIIDDNQAVRDYVKMLLEERYTVIEAVNGQDGLQQALKYVPDAIICDVMMPVMDGMECCRRLKSELQTSHIPVLMLTAYAVDEEKIKGYECGADSYLTKPFSAKLLMTRLRNLLDNHKRLQAFFSAPQACGTKPAVSDIDQTFMQKLQALINANMNNANLSIEDLSGQIGLSRVQLYRKTKALTGHSPNELLRIARLKKAASLLASSEMTIAEITYKVGFSSPSYFTRCYKDYFGENPTDFLRRTKGEG